MEKFKETILDYIAQKHEEMDIVSEDSDELEYDPETGEIL
jgi:hypothetical protein